jgi:hypothetical protein
MVQSGVLEHLMNVVVQMSENEIARDITTKMGNHQMHVMAALVNLTADGITQFVSDSLYSRLWQKDCSAK